MLNIYVCCVVDAVYAMAHSLHNLVLEQCCTNYHRATDRDILLAVRVLHSKISVIKRAIDRDILLAVRVLFCILRFQLLKGPCRQGHHPSGKSFT